MIAILLFSFIAALLVFLAGRGDQARDPRLTGLVLVLLMLSPLSVFLPKWAVLPVPSIVRTDSGFSWMGMVLGIWAIGFLITSARLVLAAKGISDWRKRSKLVGRVGDVEIRCLGGLKSPVAAGVIWPVIFVPGNWGEWPIETRQMILEHELAHHRRRDPLWRWIAAIACAVHGGNPLVIWISRRLAVQCEFACDAIVLKNGSQPEAYARLLCDFTEARPPAGLVLSMAVASSLECRVRRLMRPSGKSGGAGLIVLVALAVASAAVLASFGPSLRENTLVSPEEVELRWSANPFPGGE